MLNKHGWWFMGKKRMFMSDMLIISYQNISDNYIFSAWDLSLLPSVSSLSLSLPGVILGWVRAGTCTVGTVSSMELILCLVLRFSYQLLGEKYWIHRSLQYNISQFKVFLLDVRDTIGATGVAEQAAVCSYPNATERYYSQMRSFLYLCLPKNSLFTITFLKYWYGTNHHQFLNNPLINPDWIRNI